MYLNGDYNKLLSDDKP